MTPRDELVATRERRQITRQEFEAFEDVKLRFVDVEGNRMKPQKITAQCGMQNTHEMWWVEFCRWTPAPENAQQRGI